MAFDSQFCCPQAANKSQKLHTMVQSMCLVFLNVEPMINKAKSKTEDIFLQCKASCNMQLTNKPPLQITRSILMPHEKFRACISLCITSLRSTALQSSSTFMSNRCKISCVHQYSGAQLSMHDSIKVCLYHASQISSCVDTINLAHFKACDG